MTRPLEQALLARLALSAPNAVPIEVLIDDVWGQDPPVRVIDALRVHVSNLRKGLAGASLPASQILVTTRGGYRLDLGPNQVDVQALELASSAEDAEGTRAMLAGWPEADLGRFDTGSGFFTAAATHIEDVHARAVELVAREDLDAGRGGGAVDRLEEVLRHRPYRERSWSLLVDALNADHRRTEALRVVSRARSVLGEVGIEPGPELAAAEEVALNGDHTARARYGMGRRWISGYVEVDGARVAYATVGKHAATLLFLHGGFVPFEVMGDEPRLARFLAALSERFRVVLVDRRGIGMSDPPADGQPVTLEHWVADCCAVLDAVGARDTIVVGHENGGPVALRLAADHGERVRGLVLHSTVARYLRAPDHPYGPSEQVYEWIDRMIERRLPAGEVVRSVAPSVDDDGALASWLDRAGRLGAGPSRARALHRVYVGVDVRHVLPRVGVPTIVLQPTRRIHSDPGQARYLAEHLPDAELQLLDSGDHLPWLADADTVLAAVQRVAERASGDRDGPLRLRALLGVASTDVAPVLMAGGAEVCVDLDGAVVATFTSRAAAEAARVAVRRQLPRVRTAITVDDTRASARDAAVIATAALVRP